MQSINDKKTGDVMRRILILCLLIAVGTAHGSEGYRLERVEPANWWVGMKYNQVELLVYGQGISDLHPSIHYPGVSIQQVARVENANYLFVTLNIAANAKPGKFFIHFSNESDEKIVWEYYLLAREKGSAERQGFSPKDMIYLITPDRFANGNSRNDSLPELAEKADRMDKNGRHGGDIAGMIQHLDYLAGLGVTQIWPNPLTENNQPSYSYHGYATTNLYQIDARYGSNEDFKTFVTKARAKGIGVIKDIVVNHIGSEHWWMKDLPSRDWLNYPDQYRETNHRRTVIQDPYAAPEDKALFVDGWFVPTMPDLNQRNPHLARYLIQNSIWWVEYAGLSGIREDTYGYADEKFLSDWAKAIMDEYPNFNIVGEEWSSNPAVVAHWLRGKQNPSGHLPYMPSMMDFPIHEALRIALEEQEGWDTGLVKLYETLANDFIYPDPFNLVIFPENHDTSRIYSYLHDDIDLFKSAMIYMATMRGIPQLYYGSEVLLSSPRHRDDGAIRSDMPGGWSGDKKNAFTGKGLTNAERDAQDFIRTLFRWRKSADVIHHGKLQHFAPQDGTYVYFRYLDNRAVMVAINKNKQEKTLDLKRFNALLADKQFARDVISGKAVDIKVPLVLSSKQSLVIELK
ncbi:glycoside hydrolase family 13 protein [Cellvibrio japonicus]|uniref:glycoside hydrolase family 13 protein n=1 Tax=Cellvibrio japonicus TaxID=155077 RepID=UPI001FD4B8E7|nr:glycoside hydrolase family 13 protein [Cellvibrio japonicus]